MAPVIIPQVPPASSASPQIRGLADFLGVGNPIQQIVASHRGTLSQIGAGLASGQNFSAGLSNAAQNMPLGRQQDDAYAKSLEEQRRREEAITRTAAAVRNMGAYGGQLADMVEAGAIDPGEAYWKAMDFQRAAQTEQQTLARNRGNAAFLTDPALKAAVESGSMSFADAYKAQQSGTGGNVDYSTQPVYGRDANGNTVVLQLGDNGTGTQTQFPAGITPMGPGDLAGARTSATVDAKSAGAARAALPAAEQAYAQTLKALEEIQGNATGVDQNFGSLGPIPTQKLPAWPGSPLADMRNQVDQLSGQAFLQIRQALKGAGQVTDYEGQKGEIAISRMKAAADSGSQPDFNAALAEYKDAVETGLQLLREQATGGYQQGTPAVTGAQPVSIVNPQTGERMVLQAGQWVPAQ